MKTQSKEWAESKLPNEDGQEIGVGCPAPDLFALWVKEHPKPKTQDWYWWRPFPEGVEKVFEIYRTERFGIGSWVLCHPYGEMEIGIALKRWPHSEWSSAPIQRPNNQAHSQKGRERGPDNTQD